MDPISIALLAGTAAQAGGDLFGFIAGQSEEDEESRWNAEKMAKAYAIQNKSLDMQNVLAKKNQNLDRIDYENIMSDYLLGISRDDSQRMYNYLAMNTRR